jgi:hypothetical protein
MPFPRNRGSPRRLAVIEPERSVSFAHRQETPCWVRVGVAVLSALAASVLALVVIVLLLARAESSARWDLLQAQVQDVALDRMRELSCPAPLILSQEKMRGGHILASWRELKYEGVGFSVLVRQDRQVFGTTTTCHVTGNAPEDLLSVLSETGDRVDPGRSQPGPPTDPDVRD